MTETYFIKPGYRPNLAGNMTYDEDGRTYWTEARLHAASHYQHAVYVRAAQLVAQSAGKAVVDLGCGPGTKLMSILAPVSRRAVGVDQPSAIATCQRLFPSGEFYADDLEKPQTDLRRACDVSVTADVIEHLIDPDQLLALAIRSTRPGGYLVVSTPERDVVRGRACMESPKSEHVREWNKAEFADYLESRGFEIIEHRLVAEQRPRLDRDFLAFARRDLTRLRAFRGCQMIVARVPARGRGLGDG